ncbi:MAG: hypothetical protein JST76_06110 [Bacteroidetes bacterium]|nr:hypothetical protein [Bacteroidota bacterium]
MATTLFISEQYIKDKTPLGTNIDVKFILPQIEFAQDSYTQNILGSKFYKHLQASYSGQTLTTNEVELVGLIKPALAYRAAEATLPFIHIQIRNSGTVNLNADNGTVQSSISDMKYLREVLKSRAEFYENQITDYLAFNADLFPDYTNPDAEGIAPSLDTSTTCDLYFRNYGYNTNNLNNLGYCRCGNISCNGYCLN